MSRAYVLAARRTAVAPRRGAFAALEAWELAAPVLRAVLADAGIEPGEVDEVILGNALSGGGNVARLAALAAGLPERVPALTIDRQCTSGLDAIMLAARLVGAGAAHVVLAGGVESWSRSALRARRPRAAGGEPEFYDAPPFSPWPDRDPDMVEAAAALARAEGISREAQDAYAVASHRKALGARAAGASSAVAEFRTQGGPNRIDPTAAQMASRSGGEGRPDPEIVVLPDAPLPHDAFTRKLTPALCARSPVLAGEGAFAVDAATVAVEADAAAVVLVVSAEVARRFHAMPVEIRDALARGGPPEQPALAIPPAARELLARNRLAPADLARIELMEAFAVQALANIAALGLAEERVNVGGGALARGHPVGASGAILAVRLFHELKAKKPGSPGLAAIAAAGGLATAMLLCSNDKI